MQILAAIAVDKEKAVNKLVIKIFTKTESLEKFTKPARRPPELENSRYLEFIVRFLNFF